MMISTGFEHSFVEQARRDLKEIENRGVSKLETLDDLRDTTGKSFRTADIEKLMEKYDPDAYERYKQIAHNADGGHSRAGLSFLSKWMDDIKAGNIIENKYDNKLWKRYDISDDRSRSDVTRVETLADLRNAKGMSFMTEDIANLMKKYDPDAYKTYCKIAITPGGELNPGGIQFLNKWVNAVKNGFIKESDSASSVKTNEISAQNEEKLSKKAQDFLKNLRAKYGNYDFMIGNGSDEIRALSKSGSKEFSVIFSSAEIEKMANDEKYAATKMYAVENSINMCRKICEQQGYVSAFDSSKSGIGVIGKIGVVSDDNGNMKFFAELEKTSVKQKERLEKSKEKKADDKKIAEKHAHKKNPYVKDTKDTVKRTTIEAGSINEFLDKLEKVDWTNISDSKSGDRFNFSV